MGVFLKLQPTVKLPSVQPMVELKHFEPTYSFINPETPRAGGLKQDIMDLETFFTGIALPSHSIFLNPYTEIVDIPKMITGHLAILKANPNNWTFEPYLNRLQELSKRYPE